MTQLAHNKPKYG